MGKVDLSLTSNRGYDPERPFWYRSLWLAAVASATNRPVVTSPYVNIAPDAAKADALVMVPNTPDEVATAITSLLADVSQRVGLGQRAQAYVQRYDWSMVVDHYIEMYEQAIHFHRELSGGNP